jgi:hypothetical protein
MYETTKQAINKSKDEINAQALQWGATRFNRPDPSANCPTRHEEIPPRNDHRFRERAEEPMD